MGLLDLCGQKGYGFSAVLVTNRVSTLAILVLNRVWLLHTSLEFGILLEEATFFSIIEESINKALHNALRISLN